MKPTLFIAIFWLLKFTFNQKKEAVIQFNVSNLLNARPVTTLTNNHLTFWTKGIDGGGTGDGYVTHSAAIWNGDKLPHALPDDALIPANEMHPAVQLHYSNTDNVHQQAYAATGENTFQFSVTKANYKAIYLALTSSEGASDLKIILNYTTNEAEIKEFKLPDYYMELSPADANLTYLVKDLAKWGPKNNMTEKDHHNIDLLYIYPNPSKTLKSIRVSKSKGGYLVFWAAAGVKAD